MKIFPKFIAIYMCFLLLLTGMAGCGSTGQLPEGLDETTVDAAAKELLNAMNQRDYERMVELYTDGENFGITPPTAEEWAASVDGILDQLGDFEGYGDTAYATVEDETFGTYGVALVKCNYKNQDIVWRVSFTPEMEIIGLRA